MNDLIRTSLTRSVVSLLDRETDVSALLGLSPRNGGGFAELAGALMARLCHGGAPIAETVCNVYRENPSLIAMTEYDVEETARRNFEPGGEATTFLFSRGIHASMAHRVAHQLWLEGQRNKALALKAVTGLAFSTDMHPGASIGAGFWLDHGLGFVVGETAVIEEDVSIWHGVTLGSTLRDSGATRHPRIERGAVIGAGAIILGNISIGAGANVAAGSVVLDNVPAGTVVVGNKARTIGEARISFVNKQKA